MQHSRSVRTRTYRYIETAAVESWLDSECRTIRRNCSRLERQYRHTRSTADAQAYMAAQCHRSKVFKDKKDQYRSDRVVDQTGSPAKLWNTTNAILQHDKRSADGVVPTPHDAEAIFWYFNEKVRSVHAVTASHPLPMFSSSAEVLMSTLRPCSEDKVRRLVAALQTKSCALDPIRHSY